MFMFVLWVFDGSKLDLMIEELEIGVKEDIYQNNNEWEMMKVFVKREKVCDVIF